jgi:glucose/mannose-6-phosphate isomerase
MKNDLDRENLRAVILDFPGQFAVGAKAANDIKVSGNFRSVSISGMGGSALPADVLKTIINESAAGVKFGVHVNRDYSIDTVAEFQSLNFFASYSGNTEETLSSFAEALKKKLPCVCFASGGKLAEESRKNHIPLVMIPSGIQPRYALGYFIGAMLKVLENSNLMEKQITKLLALEKDLNKKTRKYENVGKKLAAKIKGKTPVIYANDEFGVLAKIWKIKINENAKTPAFWNVFPEMNHNEMVGFSLPQAKFIAIFLADPGGHPHNIKRMKITAGLLAKKGVATETILMEKAPLMEKLFSGVVLGDWISYYLALAYGQDPTPVAMVEALKKKLA